MTIQIAQRIGRALGVRSGTRIRELDEGLREYVRTVPKATNTPMPGTFAASQVTSGQFANARISAASVTQHQAALAIAMSQLTGTLPANQGGSGFAAYTAGDILYANTISTLAKLGIGSAGDLLRVSGGAPAWQAPSTLSIGWGQLTGVPSTFAPADHLETGTWTPADGSAGALTLTSISATYMKHEGLVIAQARFIYPATADGNTSYVVGLPYKVGNFNAARQGWISYSDNPTARYALPANDQFGFTFYDASGVAMANSALSGSRFFVTLLYPEEP